MAIYVRYLYDANVIFKQARKNIVNNNNKNLIRVMVHCPISSFNLKLNKHYRLNPMSHLLCARSLIAFFLHFSTISSFKRSTHCTSNFALASHYLFKIKKFIIRLDVLIAGNILINISVRNHRKCYEKYTPNSYNID